MTIDKDTGTIAFTACKSEWSNGAPEEHGYFEKHPDRQHLKEHIVPRISARSFQLGALQK